VSQMEKLAEPCADPCCAPPSLVLPSNLAGDRIALIRDAFRLEWLTIGWMSIEAVVALISGAAAGSLVLIAFGLDSVVELISAGVLVWRLSIELRHGHAFSEDAERLASRIGGVLLFVLAAYVVVTSFSKMEHTSLSDALISLIPTYGPWIIFGIVALESGCARGAVSVPRHLRANRGPARVHKAPKFERIAHALPVVLKDGDVVELEVQSIGLLRNQIVGGVTL
jgi:hypothetical protein